MLVGKVIHLVLYGTLLGLFYYSWNISTTIQNEKLCTTFSSVELIKTYRYCLIAFVGVSWTMLLIQWILLFKTVNLHEMLNSLSKDNNTPKDILKKTFDILKK